MQQATSKEVSPIIKTVVTIILLLLTLFVPLIGIVGVIVMWIWAKWPKWVKIWVTLPLVIFYALSIILSVGVLSYLFVVRPFQINGTAMAPNYNNGAYLMTKVVRPNNIVINRGEVIILKAPKDTEKVYIKRVVGLPGETVKLQGGYIYINGQKLDEGQYLSPGVQTFGGTFINEGQAVAVPNDQYFVLGDNRPHSSDSREWGFVPQSNIISKVAFCYWNCGKR